jgi:hypothetical protein
MSKASVSSTAIPINMRAGGAIVQGCKDFSDRPNRERTLARSTSPGREILDNPEAHFAIHPLRTGIVRGPGLPIFLPVTLRRG